MATGRAALVAPIISTADYLVGIGDVTGAASMLAQAGVTQAELRAWYEARKRESTSVVRGILQANYNVVMRVLGLVETGMREGGQTVREVSKNTRDTALAGAGALVTTELLLAAGLVWFFFFTDAGRRLLS